VNPLLTTVATEVAGEFGSKLSAILGPRRGHAEDARSRAIAMFVYRDVVPGDRPCYTELGRVFGRDRTTVRHAIGRVQSWICNERNFVIRLKAVKERIRGRQ
jgi:chromosomal replication initiation ATPase DnaA